MSDILPNLASSLLGTRVVFATDEWFAAAENMIQDSEPIWREDVYTPFGKWMDGWESRRRRTEGNDWCIISLGLPGSISHIDVNTAFFTGNFSPKVKISGIYIEKSSSDFEVVNKLLERRKHSIESRPEYGRMGLCADKEDFSLVAALESDHWPVLVPLTKLGAGYKETQITSFSIADADGSKKPLSHLRIDMGPDGGIARVRVFGRVHNSFNRGLLNALSEIDLAAVENGGLALACSNQHYGHPRNLIVPGRGSCMGDGWETARQPARPAVYQKGEDGLMVLPGFDWAVLELGLPGVVSLLEVDTHFYKGNYPESCMVEGCFITPSTSGAAASRSQWESADWRVLLPRARLTPDVPHYFLSSGSYASPTSSKAESQRLIEVSYA